MKTSRSSRPICRFIATTIFHSTEYLQLPAEGQARLLFVFLLLHPVGGTFHTPGLYQVGPEALREAARIPRKAFTAGYQALLAQGVVEEDHHWRLLWFPAALRLIAPPANPNVVKGICRSIAQLPCCKLLEKAKEAYAAFLQGLGDPFVQPFRESFSESSQLPRKPSSQPNSDQNPLPKPQPDNAEHQLALPSQPVGKTVTTAGMSDYIQEVGWQGPSRAVLEAGLRSLPNLIWGEVDAGRRVVDARDDVADPVAYLFGVLRASRSGRTSTCAAAPSRLGDGFQGLQDGQRITWHD